jgi:hypothetical protein
MITDPRPHVFLSHVREDAERVERLAAELEARGIGTWIDRHRIRPGQRWQKAIEDAIRSGAFFVACFSKAYAARGRSYMNEELLLAIEEVRLRPEEAAWFIPIRLDHCVIPERRIGPELSIRSFQWLDMYPDWAQSIERLAEAIKPAPLPLTTILIDGDYLLAATRGHRRRFDFERLLIRLRDSFGQSVSPSLQLTVGDQRGAHLASKLRDLGYAVEALPAGKHHGGDVLGMAIGSAALPSPTLVLISGDSALAPLIKHARQEGRRTIVIAFLDSASAVLREAADDFIELTAFMLGGGDEEGTRGQGAAP